MYEPVFGCQVKFSAVVIVVIASGLLGACEPAPQNRDVEFICIQAADFIERNSEELQQPRDWNRLMAASSRLVYIENDCGELVTEPREVLCAALSDAIDAFGGNSQIPLGPNRDRALAIGMQTFRQSGCTGSRRDSVATD